MSSSWWDRHIVPRLITCACGQPVIAAIRAQVVPQACGDVLEIGCGGGLNLPFYDRAQVHSLTGIDPSRELLERTRASAERTGLPIDMREAGGEALPFDAASFDSVVITYTLCSVANPRAVLAEIARVLRPGGHVLFAEHGAAPDANVARWQRRIEPFWKPLAGGCHLTRPIGDSWRAAGFTVESTARYAPKTPRPMGWMEWGVARLASG